MDIGVLKRFLSEKRIGRYESMAREQFGGMPADEAYEINARISMEIFALISFLEIVLRNAIHRQMRAYRLTDDWFGCGDLDSRHMDQVAEAGRRWIAGHRGKDPSIMTPDDIVCNLQLGFWRHLFSKRYATSIWTPALKNIFAGAPSRPNRQSISDMLMRVNAERNRISHCESIIKSPLKLKSDYDIIVRLLSWLAPEICEWALSFNGFGKLYERLAARRANPHGANKAVLE